MKLLRTGIVLISILGMAAVYACGGGGGGGTRTTGGTICGIECSGTAVCDTPIGPQSGPMSIVGSSCVFRGQSGTATLNCDYTGSAVDTAGNSVSGTWSGSGTTVTGDFEGTWSCTITPATTTPDAGASDSRTETDSGTTVPDSGSGELLCTDTCSYAGDGDCDDGGPNSDYDFCAYGTDCTDCGPREPIAESE